MPLDGAAPTALRVSGSPVDQFSFLESEDGQLNVLVRSEAAGDGMWRAEVAEGEVALMRVPLSSFSDGTATVASSDYLPLSKVKGYFFQNRFVGDYLLYGSGSGWAIREKLRILRSISSDGPTAPAFGLPSPTEPIVSSKWDPTRSW
jgi:hypothetical protein